jgi:aminoglycoside N3'-acetyltransferase/alpha-beta hydrolase superfamily lysophospholipase
MRVEARGMTFEVRAGGPEDGEPALLLHGFPQHGGEWDDVVPALHAAGLRTYAPDQRGYSPGARPAEVGAYRIPELVDDAAAVLDALGVDAAHVVGHDWGAVVAWGLAAARPERVRTLTAVSVPHPSAMGHALATDRRQQARSAYMVLFRRPGLAEKVLLAFDAAVLRRMLGEVGDAARVARYADPLRRPGALTATLNWYRAMSGADMKAVAPVAVPTTFVWSDRDVAIGRTAAEACARHVTGDYRFVVLPGVSHWIPDRAPGPLAAAILARTAVGSAPSGPRTPGSFGPARPHTRASLAAQFRDLGVRPGGVLLVHAGLRRLGFLCGGVEAVVLALRDVLGPDGTIVVPTHTPEKSDPAGWGNPPVREDWWPELRAEMPGFDPAVSPSRFMGAVAEQVRTWPGALRSDHPQVSFAALGPAAARIVADHRRADMLGEGSPLARLYDLDADVLLLGVDHGSNTSLHLAEYRWAAAPRTRLGAPVVTGDGGREWVWWDDVDLDESDFAELGRDLEATGAVRVGPVGDGTGRLMRQRAAVDFAVDWLARNRRTEEA